MNVDYKRAAARAVPAPAQQRNHGGARDYEAQVRASKLMIRLPRLRIAGLPDLSLTVQENFAMRVLRLVLAFHLLGSVASFAQSAPSAKPGPGFSIDNIDKSVDPCVDFYQYACGNWIKNSEIPADRPSWQSFSELNESNLEVEKKILEKAAGGGPGRNAIDQKIGDLYGSCMDEKAVDAKGLSPLKPELERIAAVKDKAGLIDEIAHIHLIGPNPLFNFYSSSDLHNADQVIAYIDQGGLSLPDRDYYVKDDPDKVEMRKRLAEYVISLFTLAGQNPQQAANSSDTVLMIETLLAADSMDRTKRRDPKNRDHKMTREEAVALAPNFYLSRYFDDIGAPKFKELNVTNPDFFRQVNGVLAAMPLDALKTYVTWHVLRGASPWLSQPFVDANFKMRQALTGQKQIQDRWKRCVNLVDESLGEALGQRYVEATFGSEGKQRMLKMVDALEKSLDEDIQSLDWMSPDTKKQAKVKLQAIRNKIGYPDVWRDYSSVVIKPDNLLGNIERAQEFESKRQIAKIDKPLDRNEWGMTPPEVNAYYSGSFNEIVFPAGILQPPFFDKNMDDAVNFGGIGLVIGHELTHGFDDQGRKFDPQGNLRDWWTEQDGKEFEKRVSCVADEYSNFVAVDNMKLNGRLTLGENTADNGGARVALAALEHMIAEDKTGKEGRKIDGYTPEQRFFLGFGRVWCEKQRPEYLRMQVSTNPHSPGKYRVNGVVQNMPEFQKAWGCKAGQPMVAENACHVW
ncbi:MAG TPA: M13 family metallopeptidase [Candidatus Sulfotelmatobacter sp.]|nr:M13 family metallopeptidase [Candidatus Sulfotelmatobacter sp.]